MPKRMKIDLIEPEKQEEKKVVAHLDFSAARGVVKIGDQRIAFSIPDGMYNAFKSFVQNRLGELSGTGTIVEEDIPDDPA